VRGISQRRVIATNVALAVAYVAIGYGTLGFEQASGLQLARVLWLSSGVALTIALTVDFPVWLGVGLGAALATALDGSPALHVVGTGIANGGEIGLAAWALRRLDFNACLVRVRDVVLFLGIACGASAALAALLSVVSLFLTGGGEPGAFGRIWLLWWLTHALGMLVVVPPGLALAGHRTRASTSPLGALRWVLPAVAATASVSFLAPPHSLLAELFFLPVPLLLMCAVRGDALGAALGGLIVTLAAVAGAVTQRGPFMGGNSDEALFLTWSFPAVLIVSTVIATALVDERRRAHESAAAGERRLRAVLEATSEGIVVADAEGRVTDVNSAFLRLAPNGGRDAALAKGAQPLLASLDARDEEGAASPLIMQADIHSPRRFQAELRLGDGKFVDVESAPLEGGVGVSGRVWSIRDVTERVRSEEERRRLHDQFLHSQKLEGLGVLAGGVAHDFNNLLMGIVGYAELLLEQGQLDAQGSADVEGIIKTAMQASGLCKQLLTYAGKTTPILAPIDLAACIEDVRRLLAVSVSKNVSLGFEFPREPVFAVGDEVQLRQVLLNLVTNASDAVLEGTGRGAIVVRVGRRHCTRAWLERAFLAEAMAEGDYAVLEVEDDGVGMDAATANRIFDPFFSSKGAGRGLGLAATLGVVRSHSGALVVESEKGVGTRFQLALPLAETLARPVQPIQVPRNGERHQTVLVVDDEDAVRETVTRMIRRKGYDVLNASDGDMALAMLQDYASEIDLVLLDLTMPRRDGLATLEAMRELGLHVPVLLASGFSEEAIPADVAVAGFVQKPFRSQVLGTLIEQVLG
jgi:PAS domain S-box-containing protein